MDEIIAKGPKLLNRGNNEAYQQHTSSTQVPTTAPSGLWEAATRKETALCLLHQGSLHDFNMAQRMVNPAHMSKTIRLGFP